MCLRGTGDIRVSIQSSESFPSPLCSCPPSSNHLSNGKDAVGFKSVESYTLPVSRLDGLSPPRRVSSLLVEVLVGSTDDLRVCGRGELLCDVDLLSNLAEDGEVV